MIDDIEAISNVSRHPVFGVVEFYNSIMINQQWYRYDRVKGQLVRSTKPALQEGLFDGEE